MIRTIDLHDRFPGDWGSKHSPVETDPSQWRSKILVLKSYIIPLEEEEVLVLAVVENIGAAWV